MTKEETAAVGAQIKAALEDSMVELQIKVEEAVKAELEKAAAGAPKSPKDIEALIAKKVQELGSNLTKEYLGIPTKANWKKDLAHDPEKDKTYGPLDTITVKPTQELIDAKLHVDHADGKEFNVVGTLARQMIRDGKVTFVKVAKVYVAPERKGKVIGKSV